MPRRGFVFAAYDPIKRFDNFPHVWDAQKVKMRSDFSSEIQPNSNNEKIVLSCTCYGAGYLELWVFGDMGRA